MARPSINETLCWTYDHTTLFTVKLSVRFLVSLTDIYVIFSLIVLLGYNKEGKYED
jgi:hypothetical protein